VAIKSFIQPKRDGYLSILVNEGWRREVRVKDLNLKLSRDEGEAKGEGRRPLAGEQSTVA